MADAARWWIWLVPYHCSLLALQTLATSRSICRSGVWLGKDGVQAGFTAGGRMCWLLTLRLSNYQKWRVGCWCWGVCEPALSTQWWQQWLFLLSFKYKDISFICVLNGTRFYCHNFVVFVFLRLMHQKTPCGFYSHLSCLPHFPFILIAWSRGEQTLSLLH